MSRAVILNRSASKSQEISLRKKNGLVLIKKKVCNFFAFLNFSDKLVNIKLTKIFGGSF